jgi:hypothetical protein
MPATNSRVRGGRRSGSIPASAPSPGPTRATRGPRSEGS